MTLPVDMKELERALDILDRVAQPSVLGSLSLTEAPAFVRLYYKRIRPIFNRLTGERG